MPHFLAKESAGNAGSKRAAERHCPKNTEVSLVEQPTPGTPFRHLADFRFFFKKAGENEVSHESSIRMGRATATRRRRQAAARLAFHCAHSIIERFREPPPRLVPGRRASCVDRVPSASQRKL